MGNASADRHEATLLAVLELLQVMARLRAECPWTSQQTHESLRPYLVEEAWEAVDAIASGSSERLAEELGDVLMQVVFHSAIAESDGEGWSFADVARLITDKLVHRSPHVFGDAVATTPEEVDTLWRERKAGEPVESGSGDRDADWAALPALVYAQKVVAAEGWEAEGDDIGARLARLVGEAAAVGVDAEAVLRETVRSRTGDGNPK